MQQPGGGGSCRQQPRGQRRSGLDLRLVHRRISPPRISRTWRRAQQTSKRNCCKCIMYLFSPAIARRAPVHVRRCASPEAERRVIFAQRETLLETHAICAIYRERCLRTRRIEGEQTASCISNSRVCEKLRGRVMGPV